MRGAVVHRIGVKKENKVNLNLTGVFKKYLLKPLTGGILGYLSFFTLLIISKYLGFLIGNSGSFKIDLIDLLISFLGFAFIFVIKLKENIKGKIS